MTSLPSPRLLGCGGHTGVLGPQFVPRGTNDLKGRCVVLCSGLGASGLDSDGSMSTIYSYYRSSIYMDGWMDRERWSGAGERLSRAGEGSGIEG